MGRGRPKGVTSRPYKFLFRVLFRLFLRKNGHKMGEGGNIVCGEKQKTPLYNSLKKRCFFITAIHIFSILISAYDLKFSKAINLTSISNSSHIVVVCSICINIYHDFLLFEIFDLLFKCNHLCFSFFRLLFLLVLSQTPSFLFCS